LLGTLAKLQEESIRSVMSVRLSSRMEQLGSHSTDLHEILYLRIFRNPGKKIQVSLKLDKLTGTSSEENYALVIIPLSLSFLLTITNVSNKSSSENENRHFVFSRIFFLRKSCRL
jgi:hypothetical protein